jgi:hypothetical protein
MIKKFITISATCAATITLTAQTVSYDFTSGEGWSEGVTLNGTNNFNTQTQWVANDVASAGYASSSADFTRAVLFNSFTFGVGDSFTLVANLSMTNVDGNGSKATVFQFGLTDTLSPGSNTPKAGMSVRPAFLPIFIDTVNSLIASDSQQVTALATKDNNAYTYTTVITKSAIEDLFDVSIDFENGTASTSFTVVDSALYSATTVFPIFDNFDASKVGGTQLNSFSSTYLAAVPEPSAFAVMFGTLALAGAVARRKRTQA